MSRSVLSVVRSLPEIVVCLARVVAVVLVWPLPAAWAAGPATDPVPPSDRPEWRTLLYYRDTLAGVRSDHTDPVFFLSASGATDPAAELQAHLQAWRTSTEPGDQHPACRFPARFHWLATAGLLTSPPAVTPVCKGFDGFRDLLAADGVTMVYPVPHMGNVSTLFAHSFLRLDRRASVTEGHARDFTLNFAAWMRKDQTQAEIVRNGLTNGFDGIFTVIRYEKKLLEYSSMDARDIQEYRLDLTPEETAQIVRHAWELKPLHSTYRFFSSNCSNQMLHFIDVARPGLNLHETQTVYVIPKDAVNAVVDAGIVTRTRFVPSERTRQRMARTGETHDDTFRHGHESSRLLLAAGVREGVPLLEAGVRAASQDFMDPPSAWPVGAELSVLDLRVRRYEQGPTEVQRLDLFSARSMDPRDAEASPLSWRVATGFTGRRLAGDSIEAGDPAASQADRYRAMLEASEWINPFYVGVSVGPSWGGPDGVFFTLLGGEWQADAALAHGQEAWLTLQQGMVVRGEAWQGSLEWRLQQPTSQGGLPAEGSVEARAARALDDATGLFLSLNRERDGLGFQSTVAAGVSRYF